MKTINIANGPQNVSAIIQGCMRMPALSREDAAKIKARDMLPSEYLKNNGGYFMEDEVKESARRFVKEYYEGAYREDVIKFAKDKLNAELYGFPFRWEDYDAFKVHIDEAFERYGG